MTHPVGALCSAARARYVLLRPVCPVCCAVLCCACCACMSCSSPLPSGAACLGSRSHQYAARACPPAQQPLFPRLPLCAAGAPAGASVHQHGAAAGCGLWGLPCCWSPGAMLCPPTRPALAALTPPFLALRPAGRQHRRLCECCIKSPAQPGSAIRGCPSVRQGPSPGHPPSPLPPPPRRSVRT